ncbi:MAG: DUF2007 domain-containing protein [Chromatiales bacterium]|nr:DUF2007 domain-containing protein [Chromatiales bacterium]
MKRIYTDANLFQVGLLRSVLEEHGVACMVKNEMLSGGVGELPAQECWPELWILDDTRTDAALALVEDALSAESSTTEPWQCPACQEIIEPPFSQCWQCAATTTQFKA